MKYLMSRYQPSVLYLLALAVSLISSLAHALETPTLTIYHFNDNDTPCIVASFDNTGGDAFGAVACAISNDDTVFFSNEEALTLLKVFHEDDHQLTGYAYLEGEVVIDSIFGIDWTDQKEFAAFIATYTEDRASRPIPMENTQLARAQMISAGKKFIRWLTRTRRVTDDARSGAGKLKNLFRGTPYVNLEKEEIDELIRFMDELITAGKQLHTSDFWNFAIRIKDEYFHMAREFSDGRLWGGTVRLMSEFEWEVFLQRFKEHIRKQKG